MTEPSKAPIHPCDLLVRAVDRAGLFEESFRHPLNPQSELHGVPLSRKTGLSRLAVSLLRVPPKKESYAFHSHDGQEEWMFVLSGKGVAQIGEELFEVGPGDFIGFPAGSYAHHLHNAGAEDLVYLCGGDNPEVDVADYPREAKRLVRLGKTATVYPLSLGESFWPTR